MASTEQKQELVEDIKRPIKHYRIAVYGYGGEYVYGTLTREQFEYWKDREDELSEYVLEPESQTDVPDEASFLKRKDDDGEYFTEWFEFDDVDHFYGAEHYGSSILIEELDNDDLNSDIIDTVYEGELIDFIDQNNSDIVVDESNSLINPDKKPIVGMYSTEKGTFFEAIISTQGRIDFSKLDFFATEFPGDTVLTSINYDGEELDNEGGDTNGKGFHVFVYDD